MARQRLFIYELPKKLEVLMHDRRVGSWKKFVEFSGIGISTLKQVQDINDVAYSRLGPTHRLRLCAAFGFPPDMPEWISPDRVPSDYGPGPDTGTAFAKAYRQLCAARDSVEALTGGGSAVVDSGKPHAARDVTAKLAAGKHRPSISPLGTMAQVALALGQPAGPGATQVLVEMSCHQGNIVGSDRRFSVRRALLSINCGDARGRRSALAGLDGVPIALTNASGETRFTWLGSERLLRWEVSAGGAMIGYLWFDAGIVEELGPGDVLRVTLSAWLKHIDTNEIEDEPTFGIVDADGRALSLPEDRLTIEQRRIIEHVNKLKLATDGNGQAEIASAELELIRVP